MRELSHGRALASIAKGRVDSPELPRYRPPAAARGSFSQMDGDSVQLWGVDFGSTTCSAAAAAARLVRGAGGRIEVGEVEVYYQSPITFTPFVGPDLDLEAAGALLCTWLRDGAMDPGRLLGGGALVTGLAARCGNASGLAALLRSRLGPCILTTTEDPCLESWVAFMASCAELSRASPERFVLNLDIGGGTTNLALGRGGSVLATGALHVGARHIKVRPDSFTITALSEHAKVLLRHAGIEKRIGDSLIPAEVERILTIQVRQIEAVVRGEAPDLEPLIVVPLRLPEGARDVAVTVTGGVGDLVYKVLRGEALPARTAYGDLGIELACALARSPVLFPQAADPARGLTPRVPARATVYGSLLYGTEVSGTTLFLPHPEVLPLPDLPILARLGGASTDAEIEAAVRLAARCPRGACLHLVDGCVSLAQVRALASRLRGALVRCEFPRELPLVLLVTADVGKLLGSYVTEWGRAPLNLVVLDEVSDRPMAFVSLGPPREQVVPVSFYGMRRM